MSAENLSHFFSTFQDLLPAIREQRYIEMQFPQFGINPEIHGHYGKLSELHFNVSLSSNRREKVLNSIEIWWTQDLRVQHKEQFSSQSN